MIDTHVHCWDTSTFGFDWLSAFPSLPRRCLLDHYAASGGRRPESVVLVEAGAATSPVVEAAWLAARVADPSAPAVAGVIANVPVERGRAVTDDLDVLLDMVPIVCGVRRNLEALPVDASRAESFRDGVRAVGERGLGFDLCASGRTLDDAVALAAALPEMRFVLDHAGKPMMAGDDDAWSSALHALGGFENVWCKLSGLLVRPDGSRPSDSNVVTALRAALGAFGPERSMLGSDWPVLTVSATTDEWWALADRALEGLDGDDRSWIERRAAQAAYRLGGDAGD